MSFIINAFRFGGGGGGGPESYFSGNFTEGYWPTDDPTTMWTTDLKTTNPTNGVTVAVVESLGGGPDMIQGTGVLEPQWIEARGSLAFGNDTIVAALPSRGSDMYIAFILDTSDTEFVMIGTSASTTTHYAIYARNIAAAVNNGIGTPSYKVNGVTQSWADSSDAFAAIATGSKVLVEIIGADLTHANWANLSWTDRGGAEDMAGETADLYIAENTAAVRTNVPGLLAARHGITL